MSATIKEIELLLDQKLDQKLKPISDQIATLTNDIALIKRDLSEMRRDLGYNNLTIIKGRHDKEEM